MWHEVVGVVADVRAWGLDQIVQPEFYLPMAQVPPEAWNWISRTMDLVLRTQDAAFQARDLQSAVASVAPGVPVYKLSSMHDKISGTLERSYFQTYLLSLFAAAALLLSSVGIYGVLAYLVAQRTREIGICMALGASQTKVMRDILRYGFRLTAVGLLLGLAASLALSRALSTLLYGISSTDPATFVVVVAALSAVTILACYFPARRAMRVDPIIALRYE